MSRARVGVRFVAATTAALSVLAGCGGGAEPSSATPALRAQAGALAAGPVSAQTAADMLMDVAEGRYSQFFPGHPVTLSMAPFAFRYYPTTGIYLGVVVAGGTAYELNGVYAMGGPFGADPTYLGPLSAFITPVDLSAGGTDNGCYDLSIYDGSGRQIKVVRTLSGSVAGTSTTESQIGAMVTFQGQQSRETALTITTSFANSTATDEIRNYTNHSGDGELTSYGSVSAYRTSVNSAPISTMTVYSPPFAERRYRLAIGESAAQAYASNLVGSSTYTAVSSVITYVGRETITVPAGTYEACKFETVTPASLPYTGSISTEWVVAGQGISVKRTTYYLGSSPSNQTTTATSVIVNGQPL